MSAYTGIGIAVATGATVILAKLGIVRHQGPTIKNDGNTLSAPSLNIGESLQARSGPWSNSERREVIEATSVVLPFIQDTNIKVHPSAYPRNPESDKNSFHIFVPLKAVDVDETAHAFAPVRICGMELSTPLGAYSPKGNGLTVFDETGFPIAELEENRLILLVECDPTNSAEMRSLFESILLKSLGEKEEQKSELKGEANLEAQKSLHLYLPDSLQEKSLSKIQEKRDRELQALTKLIEQDEDLRDRIGRLQLCKRVYEKVTIDRVQYMNSLHEDLLATQGVERVEFHHNKFSLHTEKLSCRHPFSRQPVELGQYRIDVYYDGSNHCVRWFNKSGQVGPANLHGPRIDSEGRMFTDDVLTLFPRLIGEKKFVEVANFAVKAASRVPRSDSNAVENLQLYV